MKRSAFMMGVAIMAFAPAVAMAQTWSDNFDSYENGTDLHGVGGWLGWDDTAGATGFVTDAQSRSGPHSVEIVGGADLVQEYTANAGQWTYTAWMYLPQDTHNASTFFIMLNQYNVNGPKDWAIQNRFLTNGLVRDDLRGNVTLPIIYDEWVEWRLEIDLDANTVDTYYGGDLLSSGTWTVGGGSNLMEIGCVDLFANGPLAYYDDMSLVPASSCDACDMDCDGDIDAFDIEPFLALLFDENLPPCCGTRGSPPFTGDTDGDGDIDAFDIEPFLECLFP